MAGGKETPRQKMIGMMYLVLTALLALNVSKQIVAAFVTLNDKLDASSEIIHKKNMETYHGFDQKKAALVATKGDMTLFKKWEAKSEELQKETAIIVGYLLGECNAMIEMAEGVSWVEEQDEEGNITKLKPLMEIQQMDNYDIPTNMFVGGNPQSPDQRGLDIRLKIHEYRNKVCEIMGSYKQGKKEYKFVAPSDDSDAALQEALKGCNEKDTTKIAAFYRSLTIPEKLHSHDHGAGEQPWPAVTFDHAPIVAAAAMFTSLKLDVKNAESMASEFMLGKIDAPVFNFNKIEPLAFARTGYINQGDSLDLKVMIAAYDSNEVSKIRFGMDEDTIPEKWKEVTGTIPLSGDKPGPHRVKGTIGVKEKGEIAWKPWSFDYTVGQPMGVVALPEMRVLYRGYDNIVEGTASGFPADRVTLSGSGCSISSKGNNQYVARVGSGVRTAKISVSGKKDDGSSVQLGSFDFKVKALPTPNLYLGGIKNGQTPGLSSVKAQSKVSCRYDETVPLTGVTFKIQSGTVMVDGLKKKGKVLAGGTLDGNAKSILKQSKGKQVTILVNYKGPDGIGKKTACVFTTR
ncbi:MAG: hypothetical protein MI810_08740 [Flavobacteriales bacterium]|nr:hypothetical protein [Flavobacteriales bacterium]